MVRLRFALCLSLSIFIKILTYTYKWLCVLEDSRCRGGWGVLEHLVCDVHPAYNGGGGSPVLKRVNVRSGFCITCAMFYLSWLAGWLASWLGWLAGWAGPGWAGPGWAGWLAGWLAGWVAGLAGWLTGWLG